MERGGAADFNYFLLLIVLLCRIFRVVIVGFVRSNDPFYSLDHLVRNVRLIVIFILFLSN